jgi:hypothetical protein
MRTDSALPPLQIDELKIRASLLLKGLRSDDSAISSSAAERFRKLPAFSSLTQSALLASRDTIQLKHALATIAFEQGHNSWADLRRALEARGPRFTTEAFFDKGQGLFLNLWFTTHAEARSELTPGHFLFPYRKQFFVCERGFLEFRGIDADDPDWTAMGFDWVMAKDTAARDRLEAKLVALGFGR